MALFDEIIADHTSGSGTILKKTQESLLGYDQGEEAVDTGMIMSRMDQLIAAFPQFALLHHFHHYLTAALREPVCPADLHRLVRDYMQQWETAQQDASRALMEEVELADRQILLHSNSSAIQNLLAEVLRSGARPVVWQTFSSPGGEGADQALSLKRLGAEVHFFHEDNLLKFLPRMDMAILGADMILGERFLNKSGSHLIALACYEAGKPVYVIAEKRKLIPEGNLQAEVRQMLELESNKPEEELMPFTNAGIHVYNHYFEFTPLSLVNRLFLG